MQLGDQAMSSARERMRALHRASEQTTALALCDELAGWYDHDAVVARAEPLVEAQRERARGGFGVERFLQEYGLGSEEGLRLLCLAEAFLRIPDGATASALIHDKIDHGDWGAHLGRSDSAVVNASTLALRFVQRLSQTASTENAVVRLLARGGEPALRAAVAAAIRLVGDQFVFATTIEGALARASGEPAWRYSFDMLGEAARTRQDAARYLQAYRHAVSICAAQSAPGDPAARASVSIKLSALHPRYEEAQRERVLAELSPQLLALAEDARSGGVSLLVDAEESERLDLSLDLVQALLASESLRGWTGLGLAVQAYSKRACAVIDWAEAAAARAGARMTIRLVKGAYWDSEIRRTQLAGLDGFAVFTRKAATDVSYLACVRALLSARHLFPAFATHNALSVAAVLECARSLARDASGFEFQRLHGMGEGLYDALIGDGGYACRIYAPVGAHRDLLAYLVRRMLENGANTSFVHRIVDASISQATLFENPVAEVRAHGGAGHARVALPANLYLPTRANSRGLDLHDRGTLSALADSVRGFRFELPTTASGSARALRNPADSADELGMVSDTPAEQIAQAVATARAVAPAWAARHVDERARILEAMAERLEQAMADFVALLVREAGRTLADSVSEVREAVDFCRYYAAQARAQFELQTLAGPTGECNTLRLAPRGVFACVSPWNFPLAIFTGQIAAALVCGNSVVAKPAPQTPLVAMRALAEWRAAGLPQGVLSLVTGDAAVGRALVGDAGIDGVAFTGSVATGRAIAQALALRTGPLVPLVAETGGLNSMIVDASALPEQVVSDALISAFNSAGQRCSALRLMWLQEEIADRVIEMLCGAMDELRVGDPRDPATDVGPVIDAAAMARLEAHVVRFASKVRHRTPIPPAGAGGYFFAPTLIELARHDELQEEVFGPVLHVVRWRAGELDAVIEAVNASGFGLTLGVHSRIDEVWAKVQRTARVGNLYVNRSMIGAVVGVQPFGGEGLSGTGPKAGGPHSLLPFTTERAVSIDTTSAGGNASLLAENDD